MNEVRVLSTLCVALSLIVGCKAHPNDGAPAGSAVAPAGSAAAAPASAPMAKAKPWFAGGFSGNYEAKLVPVQITAGAVREWGKDDGKASSGPGKLTLNIDDDGLVDGTSEGALGASHASGKVDEDTLRVQLAPNDDTGLHGVLVATRDGDGFKGTIDASTGDSLRVRQASIELKKQAN